MKYYQDRIEEAKIKHTAAEEVGDDQAAKEHKLALENYQAMQSQVN